MRKVNKMLIIGMFLGIFSEAPLAAQDSVEGKWDSALQEGNKVNISHTFRSKASNKRFHDSTTIPLDNLSGLAAVNRSNYSAAQFELRRDSGTIYYTGSFGGGAGNGDFRFAPNADFARGIASMGFAEPTVEQLFMMAVHNVEREFIHYIHSQGYRNLTVDNLFSLRIHRVTPEFMQALKDVGYNNVSIGDLISMRIHGADAEYIREVKSLGYDNLSGDDLISMRIHKVTVAFIKEMNSLGYNSLSSDDLVRLKIHRVTPEFVDELNRSGQTGLSVSKLIQLRRQRR